MSGSFRTCMFIIFPYLVGKMDKRSYGKNYHIKINLVFLKILHFLLECKHDFSLK